jgi:hypothetical protein
MLLDIITNEQIMDKLRQVYAMTFAGFIGVFLCLIILGLFITDKKS